MTQETKPTSNEVNRSSATHLTEPNGSKTTMSDKRGCETTDTGKPKRFDNERTEGRLEVQVGQMIGVRGKKVIK